MLKIVNVTKNFNDIVVLDNVSIEVEHSDILGLTGPSGSGKSTLLRLIQGLEKPDSGEVICNKRTTFMFQDFQLFPHMTVLENLTYAPNLSNKKDIDNNLRAISMLDKLNMGEKASSYPNTLSGGQKQRVALCRNLMMNPELLLCDEPTSGLDVATIQDVISLIKSVQESGVSVIIASHDLDFVTRIATRIILLNLGEIVTDIRVSETKDPVKYLSQFYK